MERYRTGINSIAKYPDNDTMELFLSLGQTLNLFETIDINITPDKTEERYKNGNAIHILAIISDYIQGLDDKKKPQFIIDIKQQPKGEIYRKMSDMVLEIWLEKGNNEYTRQRTQIWKNKLGNRKDIDIKELPIIPETIFPGRYSGKSNIIIDKLFQERLTNENNINQEADNIQKATSTNIFIKPDNTKEIDGLKNNI